MSTTHLPHEGARTATSHQLAWLHDQLDEWRAEGLLDDTTSDAIWGRYRASRRLTIGRLLLTLGGGFVGVGLIWLVVANLDQIPPLARLAGVAVIAAALVAAGEVLATRRSRGAEVPAGLVVALRLAATLAFGATVFQAAQNLDVAGDEPAPLGFWAAGALLYGYAVRSVVPLAVGLLTGAAWWVWQLVDSAPSGVMAAFALLTAGSVLVGLAAVHAGWRPRFAPAYRELGVALGLAGLFVAALPNLPGDPTWTGWLALAVAGAVAAVAAGSALTSGADRTEPLVAALVALAGTGLVLWDTGPDTGAIGVNDWLHAVAGVAAYVFAAVGVAVLGTLRDSWRLTSLATAAIVAFTTIQSFAVFARIVQGAWLFVVLGLVFCGTGLLFDRARRRLAANLELEGG